MSIVNTSQIKSLLRPGIKEVFFDYKSYNDQWKEIFKIHSSDKAVEYDVEMEGLASAYLKQQGAPSTFGSMKEAYTTAYYHNYYSIGVIFTRQAIVDNLYKDRFPMAATNLKNSLRDAKNVQGANVLNNGFNAAFPVGDGQALFSTAHPMATGTGSNTFSVPVALNEASVQDAFTLIQDFKSQSGIRLSYKPEMLVVPKELQFQASILCGSKYRTETANNDINPITDIGLFPRGYTVNQYLTSPTAWFITTDCPNGFKYYEREPIFFNINTDNSTQNVLITATERYSFGVTNWRAAVGSQGV